MNAGEQIAQTLLAKGYNFWTGVPCSYLQTLFDAFLKRREFLPATREDAACGLAAGAYFSGALPVIAMQNSGFASASNAIASLLIPYRIPALLIVSWRGHGADSAEHEVMGRAFLDIANAMQVPIFHMLARTPSTAVEDAARAASDALHPVIVAVNKGVL